MEGIVQSLVDFFSNTIPAELTVFTLSLMPIIELSGRYTGGKAAGFRHVEGIFHLSCGNNFAYAVYSSVYQ